jgi:uncharacterized protein with GYD domain
MPTYVVLGNWTDKGIAGFNHSDERVFAHDAEIRKHAGVELKEIYWTQGQYDLVCVMEAHDDESMAAAMLGIAALGYSRTTTLRAFSREEFDAIRAKVADQD